MAKSKTNHAQYGFNAGELSPRLEMRDDVKLRALGVELLTNWTINLQGPVTTSRGLEFTVALTALQGRIFPFPVSLFTGYIVVVTPENICLVDQNGRVLRDELVVNGDFEHGSAAWVVDTEGLGTVLFSSGAVTLIPGTAASGYASIYQDVIVVATEPHRLTIQIADGIGPMIVSIGSAVGLSDVLAPTTYIGDSTVVIPDLISSTTHMFVNIMVEGGDASKQFSNVSVVNSTATPVCVTFPSPWADASAIYSVQAKMAPGSVRMFFAGGNVAPQVLEYDAVLESWSFGPATFTNAPAEWTGTNWPTAIDFFQGRLYLGGTPDQPEDFWATRPGSNISDPADPATDWNRFEDFKLQETDGTINPDHAINYTMDTRGAIRWIMSQKNLVIGTENAEHIITSETGVIIPGDIQNTKQSTFGSAIAQPVSVGNELMWLSTDRTKIRSMGYEFSREQWVAKDVTFMAEHITGGGNNLLEIHYSANPKSLVLCPTELGTGVLCAYDSESKLGGFFRREMLNGFIVSSCVLPYAGRDEIWILVRRDGVLSLEKSVAGPNVKLDAYKTLFSGNGPMSTWSAPHLANQTCQALVDDAVHPDIVVEADGTFVTQYPVSKVIIGIQMYSEMRTMSLGNMVQYVGSSRAMNKRWTKLYARITGTWKPLINGRRPPTRYPSTPMGEMEPPRTETVSVANLGWDSDGRVSIVQDLPVPTEVAGIFGELTREQL